MSIVDTFHKETQATATLIIDLDHTLLDTERLKDALADALVPFGVKHEQFWNAYDASKEKQSFAPRIFADTVIAPAAHRAAAARALERVALRAEAFLFPDTLPFLRAMRACGVRLILYSFGNDAFQRLKLRGIPSLRGLIDAVIITEDRTKQMDLPEPRGVGGIIDDRDDVVRFYADAYGMTPFLLRRHPDAVRDDATMRIYHSLHDVADVICRQWFS